MAMLEFHHLGVACKDINKTREFIKLNMEVLKETPVLYDKLQDANLQMITLKNGIQIELISGKPVANFIKKGITYYHTCYSVTNIDDAINNLKQKYSAIVISNPKPAVLFNNKKVAFLFTKELGIIELLEK